MSVQAQQTPDTSAPVAVLDEVFAEIVALYQSLRAVATKIHEHGGLSSDSWTILQGIDRDGAKTVADLAELLRLRAAGPAQGLAGLAGGWEDSNELVSAIERDTRSSPRAGPDLDAD